METVKNFAVGLFVTLIALVTLSLLFILWPFILGIGSVVVFIGAIILVIVFIFYVIVLIGYVVRKGIKKKS